MESIKDWRKGKKTRLRLSAPRKSRTKIMRRLTNINKENPSFLSESITEEHTSTQVFTRVLTEDENVEVTNENNEEACPSSEEIIIEKAPTDEPGLPEINNLSQQTNVINSAVIKPQKSLNKNKKPKKSVSVKRKTKEQLLQLLAEKEEEIKRQNKIICILKEKNRSLKKKLAIALKSEDNETSEDNEDNCSVSTQMSDPQPDPSPTPNEELPSPVAEGLDSVSNIKEDPDGEQIMEDLVYQPDYNNKTVDTIDSTDPLMNVKDEPMYYQDEQDDDGDGSDEEFVDTQFELSDVFPENEQGVRHVNFQNQHR